MLILPNFVDEGEKYGVDNTGWTDRVCNLYYTNHYNLKAIIAVGNKVDSPRAVQFRKWANGVIEEFTIKGFATDDERLKNFGTVLTKDYFEEQLQRIRIGCIRVILIASCWKRQIQ